MMPQQQLDKFSHLLDKIYSLHESDALMRWITDDEAPMEDCGTLLDAIDNDEMEYIINYNR